MTGGSAASSLSFLQGWTRSFALLAVAVGGVGFFFGVQLTLFNNFIVERLGIEAHELGSVEALREVPGFLNVLFVALMLRWAPAPVAALALAVMGAGFAAFYWVDSVWSLALLSLVWSIGFHCWVPLEQAMALTLAPDEEKGKWLGRLRSVNSGAWLASIGLCMLLLPLLQYEGLFVLAGIVTVGGGLALLRVDRRRPPPPETRIVFRRRYGLYYLLNFLQGCRKQMFITFAIFALVKIHGMPVETTMVLVLINQALITATASWLGRLVDRYGERTMLSISYVGLAFVFTGYALIDHRPTLYVLYCIDNLIFFGGIALNTYVYRIAEPEELQQTLSMGVTMNHLAAVAAPLIGGFVWYHFGYQIIFLSGAVLALASLVASQWIAPAAPVPARARAAG